MCVCVCARSLARSRALSLIISTVVQLEKRLVFRAKPSVGSPEADLSDDAYYTPLSRLLKSYIYIYLYLCGRGGGRGGGKVAASEAK